MKTFKVSILLLIFLALFSFYLYSLAIANQGYWWDEAVYLGLAKNIFLHQTYAIDFPNPGQLQSDYSYLANFDESFRPPLFPSLLSSLYPLGQNVERALPLLFYFLGVIVTFFFAKKLFNEKIAFVSAIFVATSSLFIFFSSKILTESLFIFLFTSSLYSFYKSFENGKFFLLTGLLTALTILTHYPGGILIVIYVAFIVLTKKRKEIYKIFASRNFLAAVAIFVLTLLPWAYFNVARYGSVTGAMQAAFSDTQTPFFQEPWYFYLQNIFSIYGLPIIFVVPGVLAFKNFGKQWKFVAISSLIVFLFFSALGRKELRYLVPFGSVFYILCGVGFYHLETRLNRKFFTLVPIIFILSPTITGVTMIQNNFQTGKAITDAAFFLKQFPDQVVVAENYPVVNLVTGKVVFPFPANQEYFEDIVQNSSVRFVVVDQNELYHSPSYVNEIGSKNNFSLVVQFGSQIKIYETQ